MEADLATRITKLEMDIEHEERVTAEVESFLRDQHLEFSAKMTEWSKKYEEHTERKQTELENVIQAKAEGLEKLKSQTKQCKDVEKFVEKVKLQYYH